MQYVFFASVTGHDSCTILCPTIKQSIFLNCIKLKESSVVLDS